MPDEKDPELDPIARHGAESQSSNAGTRLRILESKEEEFPDPDPDPGGIRSSSGSCTVGGMEGAARMELSKRRRLGLEKEEGGLALDEAAKEGSGVNRDEGMLKVRLELIAFNDSIFDG